MSTGLFLVILLAIAFLGGFQGLGRGYGYGFGHRGMGVVGAVFAVCLAIWLLNKA